MTHPLEDAAITMAAGSREPCGSVSILGVPWDAGSSYLRGAARAPQRVRDALHCDSSNLWTEDGLDLGQPDTLIDAGDIALSSGVTTAFAEIETAVRALVAGGGPIIALGGDHSITYPIVRGLPDRHGNLTILHFDAHPDLYHEFGGPFSHACQFARIMEQRLARRLVQVGIRTMNGHQLAQARKFDVEVITMRTLHRLSDLKLDGPLYISFDLDVLDPAFAPGVSHREPGGLSVRQVLDVVQALSTTVVGADIVEYNPERDDQTQTAMVAAKVLKEIAGAMLRGGGRPANAWV